MKQLKLTLYIEFLVVAGIVAVFSVAAYQRNLVWKDNYSLWSDVVKKSPQKARPHLVFGTSLMEKGLYDQSIPELKEALRLDPHYPWANYNLGLSYYKNGLPDKAIIEYKKAIQLKPDYAMAHVNLGFVYKDMGLIDEAIKHYNMAVALKPYDPNFLQLYVNQGLALREKGLIDDAIRQ